MPRHPASAVFRVIPCLGVIVSAAMAEEPRRVPVNVDSGWVANHGTARDTIFARVIEVPDAAWLRVDFDGAELGAPPPGGRPTVVRLTSLHDGGPQILNAEHLRQ